MPFPTRHFVSRLLLSFLCVTHLTSCTYTAAVSQTNVPLQRQKPIEASVYKFMFFGLNFSNEEVFTLSDKLKEKCPDGDVRGILTKDLRTLYFVFIFWARETQAKGYCIPAQKMNTVEHEEIEADGSQQAAAADVDATPPTNEADEANR